MEKACSECCNKENESTIGTPQNVTTTKATTNASVACDSQMFEHQETLESVSNTSQIINVTETCCSANVQIFQHQETLEVYLQVSQLRKSVSLLEFKFPPYAIMKVRILILIPFCAMLQRKL